ncbi:MAG: putative hydro-lyase [Planctomycetaceae bacterium]
MTQRSKLITGADVRARCRSGVWTEQTSGLAPGFVQTNLVVLPRDLAAEFRQFCRANPKPCPIVEVLEPGDPTAHDSAPGSDLRTDLPRYRVWENGQLVEEPTDIQKHWRDDLVGFLIGCSFTFEQALLAEGVPVRHLELGINVPMYRTTVPCEPAGVFAGPLVVSMRPLTRSDAARAVAITSRYPSMHGAPVQVGYAEDLGIADLARPDYGDPVPIREDEVPVFWACGVTPQAVLAAARPPFAITHSPGCMFVTDLRDEDLAEW